MTIRAQILKTALSHIPTTAFTRPALVASLQSLRPELSDPDAVIDTIFGPGQVGPARALVEAWENEGKEAMAGDGEGKGKKGLEEVLSRRLTFSSSVGEHLVEAYANLITPSNTHSLPLRLSSIRSILSSLPSPPPSYTPPGAPLSPRLPTPPRLPNLQTLPLLHVNPLGPLSYAWRVADEALYLTTGKYVTANAIEKGDVKRGYWNEPVGPGPEWYGERIGLTLVYLAAESHLLQPYPEVPTGGVNPHLPAALRALHRNLDRYQSLAKSMENTEQNVGDAMGFVDFVARSWQGLIKSRYF